MPGGLVLRKLQEAPGGFQPSAHVSDEHHRPLPAGSVVRIARIAHPYDEGVVEHRPVPLLDRVQPLRKVRDPLGVEFADRNREFIRTVLVTDRMAIERHAQFLPRMVRPHAARRVDGHHIGQSRGERRDRNRTLRLETLRGHLAVEFVKRGHIGLQVLQRRNLVLAAPHLLERVEIDVELLAIHRGQFAAHPADVRPDPIQQHVPRLEKLPGVPLRHAAKERLEREIRLAHDGRGPLRTAGRHAVDENCLGRRRDAQADDRNDVRLRRGQRMVDGLARGPLAPVIAPQASVRLAVVPAPGHPVRKILDDRHPILERRQRRNRIGQLQIRQPAVDQLHHTFERFLNALRLDMVRIQSVAL